MAKVFVISDTHFPFHDSDSLEKVIDLVGKEKPTHVIQIGDLLDQYALSRYAKSLKIAPQLEVDCGLAQASVMWGRIKRLVPKAKLIQLTGNHDGRMMKRVMERLPELESYVKDLYNFKGVTTLKSERDFVKIDGVVYCHGWLSKSIDHAIHFGCSVVHGHRHKAILETRGKLWSMDVGFLGNEKLLPFNYTVSKVTNWTLGCGVVDNGKPRLILL